MDYYVVTKRFFIIKKKNTTRLCSMGWTLNLSSLCFFFQLFRVEVLFNERKHFVLRRSSEFQNLHRKVWNLIFSQHHNK